jgi:hypothetical protein
MSFKAILVAAGLAIATIGVSAPAEAQPRGYSGYYDRGYHDNWRGDRGNRGDRWDRRDWRDDRRWERKHQKWRERDRRHYGWSDRRGRDCWREWHHGRRIRVCSYR